MSKLGLVPMSRGVAKSIVQVPYPEEIGGIVDDLEVHDRRQAVACCNQGRRVRCSSILTDRAKFPAVRENAKEHASTLGGVCRRVVPALASALALRLEVPRHWTGSHFRRIQHQMPHLFCTQDLLALSHSRQKRRLPMPRLPPGHAPVEIPGSTNTHVQIR